MGNISTGQIVVRGISFVASHGTTEEERQGKRRFEVDVELDTYPGQEFPGKVESIAPATGSRFALLAPDNASGNFVKVVQRVPVKIVLEPGQDPEHLLRPGLSVVPTVYFK